MLAGALVDFFAPPVAGRDLLDDLPWLWSSRSMTAGTHRIRVRTSHPDLAGHLEVLLSGLPAADDGAEVHTYSVLSGIGGHHNWWAAYAQDQRISNCDQPSAVLLHLFAHLNARVVESCPADAVPLHAAACCADDRAVLIAGPSGAGKSTLAAGLVAGGLQYLTDEVAVIDSATGRVAPYAKPLSIDRGSWRVLEHLRPSVPESIAHVTATQWHLAPTVLAGGASRQSVPVRLVLLLRWRRGSPTVLRQVSRARTVVDLAMDMFRPRCNVPQQLQVLARMVEGALTCELTYGDLDEAVATVRAALEQS